jgi:predicted esterase
MSIKKHILLFAALGIALGLSGCARSAAGPVASLPAAPVAGQAAWKDYSPRDFGATHAPIDDNAYLIFGALPIARPPEGLAPELAAFLGRWEGYDFSPPVRKDIKGVLVIQEISMREGRAYLWAGYNLQFPLWVKEIRFEVLPGPSPSIRWRGDLAGASGSTVFTFALDRSGRALVGGPGLPEGRALDGPFRLSRDRSFVAYRDYPRYFASKRFYPKDYKDKGLRRYGQGYLVYLPEGYEEKADSSWPLILFLCGSGERGGDIYQFAKNGPFQMIREKSPLPFIIAAPMLNLSTDFRSFPNDYLDGVLAEIQGEYRVDAKRLYLTGLSMGGEATYRFALHRPSTFAAIAPLAAFNARLNPGASRGGFQPFSPPTEAVKGLPIWAFHGDEDAIVPLSAGRNSAAEFRKAGAYVTFTVLKGHDHDVWTDTYLDPKLYEWLLKHERP